MFFQRHSPRRLRNHAVLAGGESHFLVRSSIAAPSLRTPEQNARGLTLSTVQRFRCAGTRRCPTHEPSVEELREESQRNREALAATVGELREKVGDTATEIKTKVSPSHIKKEIKSYIREERESLLKAVQRRAQENPLQVAAVGAALAFPALSLLRAIPVPLMLIGAGLFLTSQRGQRSARRAKTRLDAAVNQGTEAVSELAGSIKSDLEDRIAGVRYGVEEARDAVTSGMSAVAGTARDVLRSGADRTAAAAAKATGVANQTAESFSAEWPTRPNSSNSAPCAPPRDPATPWSASSRTIRCSSRASAPQSAPLSPPRFHPRRLKMRRSARAAMP